VTVKSQALRPVRLYPPSYISPVAGENREGARCKVD